jgi:hypothetical protein
MSEALFGEPLRSRDQTLLVCFLGGEDGDQVVFRVGFLTLIHHFRI